MCGALLSIKKVKRDRVMSKKAIWKISALMKATLDFFFIDLMHWRHVSITTTPCWGSRLVALRARVVLAERIGAQPLSQCAGPGQPAGWHAGVGPLAACLAMVHVAVPRLTPQRAGAPFCDVICISLFSIERLCSYTPYYEGKSAERCGHTSLPVFFISFDLPFFWEVWRHLILYLVYFTVQILPLLGPLWVTVLEVFLNVSDTPVSPSLFTLQR